MLNKPLTYATELLSNAVISGKRLYVELWETTTKQAAPRLIWKNTEVMPREGAATGNATVAYAAQLSPPVMPSQDAMLRQQMASMHLYQQQQQQIAVAAAAQQAYQSYPPNQNAMQQATAGASPYQVVLQQAQIPSTTASHTAVNQTATTRAPQYYTATSSGIPTNVNRGTVRTERRGVFISNLKYDTEDKDIQKLFLSYGEIVKIDHKKEQKPNSKGKMVTRSKGCAVVTFNSSDQAVEAIQALDGCSFNDRKLNVRFDIEATPVDPPPSRSTPAAPSRRSRRTNNDGTPLIVDGSTYGRRL
jgi:predicted lipoprotein with Yx(FWY)xxD motif